jgi:hypothetical protein
MIKVPGKEVMLSGESFILAPLNLAAAKQYGEEISAVFVGGIPRIEFVGKLAYASLKRNYPEITVEKVDELVDFSNLFDILEAVMNVSGLALSGAKMVRRVQQQVDLAMKDLTI